MKNDIKIKKEDCPDFDDDDFEPILEWAEASVEWSDVMVNPKTEKRTRRPELAHWSMCWKPGFIGFCSLKENTETDKIRARCASALFIYLWCKGVEASVAAHSAEAYVNYYKVEG